MNRTNEVHGFARVDNGALCKARLIVITQLMDVSTIAGTRDRRWSCVDTAGHSHAYSVEGEPYPTLEREFLGVVDEDGWAPSILRCVICKETVEPGSIPGPTFKVLDGPVDWEVAVDLSPRPVGPMPEVGKHVTVVFSAHRGGTWFGHAVISNGWMDSQDGTRMLLRAAGQLGKAQS